MYIIVCGTNRTNWKVTNNIILERHLWRTFEQHTEIIRNTSLRMSAQSVTPTLFRIWTNLLPHLCEHSLFLNTNNVFFDRKKVQFVFTYPLETISFQKKTCVLPGNNIQLSLEQAGTYVAPWNIHIINGRPMSCSNIVAFNRSQMICSVITTTNVDCIMQNSNTCS